MSIELWVNPDLFDHGIPYTTVKWTTGMVSSLLEELKVACPNKTLTQSRWLDLVSTRMSIAEAQCYWSLFLNMRAVLLGQYGDWIDLTTLGVLLLCQVYPHIKARSDSFSRNEVLVQTLSTTLPVSQHPFPSSGVSRNSLMRQGTPTNSPKPIRDHSCIMQFVGDNIGLFCSIVCSKLTCEDDFEVELEAVDKLSYAWNLETISKQILLEEGALKHSNIVTRLSKAISWNAQLYPTWDFGSSPTHTAVDDAFGERRTLMICNQNKATLLEPMIEEPQVPLSINIVNCNETTVYIPHASQFVTLVGCTDCEIVALAVTGGVVLNSCDRVTVRVVTGSLRFENSTDCVAYAYTQRAIALSGDTRGITLAPFNVICSFHQTLLNAATGIHPDASHSITWALPICCTLTDAPYAILSPDKIRLVHFPEFAPEVEVDRVAVSWPEIYVTALNEKLAQLAHFKSEITSLSDEGSIQKMNTILMGHFREWISANNKAKHMLDIIKSRETF